MANSPHSVKKKSKTSTSGNDHSENLTKKAKSGGHGKKFPWRKVKIVSGLFLIIFSVFLFLAFLSYFEGYFSGRWIQDDDLSGKGFSLFRLLSDNSIQVHNLLGRMGAAVSYVFIKRWFGIASLVFPFLFFLAGVWLMFKRKLFPFGRTLILCAVMMLLVSMGLGYIFKGNDLQIMGGGFGSIVNTLLEGPLSRLGTGLLLIFLYLSFGIWAFNWSVDFFIQKKAEARDETLSDTPPVHNGSVVSPLPDEIGKIFEFDLKKGEGDGEDGKMAQAATLAENASPSPADLHAGNNVEFMLVSDELKQEDEEVNDEGDSVAVERMGIETPYDPTLDLSGFRFPPIELLKEYGSGTATVKKEELEENKNKIVQTLNNYAITIDKIIATIGPTVTLYEIIPAPGIRISKIKNLEDDIALSLSAYGIRIIAPIPGKGTIGIEVPNQNPEIVSMRSVISSERFQNSKMELPIALGKTISNETYVADLSRMPHLLMAGATGQGKSVGLNAIITSLLYKKHPSEVKFVLVDPKKVELSLFSKIERHYLAKLPDFEEAIITDTRKVVRVLNSMMIEMDTRYNLLKDAQVRNIKEYNQKFIARKLNPLKGHRYLPYIILFVDEFADLIMTTGKEVETPLTRLAQLARAIGIHLIIATQRPSVNIITGTIKANFPARVAFRVISKIDSRTILDTSGADQLIGRGDMLLSMGSDIVRIQCAFVDTAEIEEITSFIGEQRGYVDAFHLPEYYEEGDEGPKEFDPSERDEMFEDAARIIVQFQQGSTSLLQRKLKLGYNRAGRIMDQLESSGIVGPFEGGKIREVKIKDMMSLEQFLNKRD